MSNSTIRNNDYKIADLNLADFGRKEIQLAEAEMPALMALRTKHSKTQPLKDARIIGCIHMTIQTAVLIETLVDLGAQVRWSSCNIFSTQDHAAAAMVASNIPIFAWKGETEEDFLWCIEQTILFNGKPWNANIVIDDGGDLTQMLHEKYPQVLDSIHGISEETTTGVYRLLEMLEQGSLKVPVINVNDSVTKSKNDNKYGCRHSLNDAIKRATDMLMTGRKALVIGYGNVGKGSAQSLRQEGMIVKISEIDPICAMQACMDGFEVVSPYKNGENTGKISDINHELLSTTDLIVSATGNVNVCDSAMLQSLKSGAVVCNIGHFDNEIDTQYMRDNWIWNEIKPQVHQIFRIKNKLNKQTTLPTNIVPEFLENPNDFLILLSEGRLVNLGNATGHPSRIMDGSFANQVLAQIYLFDAKFADLPKHAKAKNVYVRALPKKLDEEVAKHMVAGFNGVITKLTNQQSGYIKTPIKGPFKPESYKY